MVTAASERGDSSSPGPWGPAEKGGRGQKPCGPSATKVEDCPLSLAQALALSSPAGLCSQRGEQVPTSFWGVLLSDRTSHDTSPSIILSHWMVTSPTTTHGAARGSGELSVPGAWRSSGRGRQARELGEGGGPVPPGQGDRCQAGQGRVGTWQQDVSEQRGQGSGMAEVDGVGGSTGGGGGARRQRGTPHPAPEREGPGGQQCWSPEPGSQARSKQQLLA